ncbi:hypothetical protein CQW23_23049 [Capsicum baccatum]|uniref:Uncharacterized protein n=1 Tax=Capsicum baccatum TaxID=33114 RepID=A0A2G2W2L4_CAPBA|nr:hypothetical protein CQW23_23049 [Capsicum baccatum]
MVCVLCVFSVRLVNGEAKMASSFLEDDDDDDDFFSGPPLEKKLCISTWEASEDSFPQLETLVIEKCSELKEIPLSFADITTLKQIKLLYSKRSLKDSAEKIKKEVEENEGYDRINLITIGANPCMTFTGCYNVMHHIDPYTLPFLPPDESRKLLQKKVFQQEGCPPELQHLSREIAERCKGLPLVIGLVAGIIKRNKMEASWWNEVKNSLLSYLGESEGYSILTMQLSYDNLPDYVKPCLLYMGMFPEDEGIPVTKLISLWIAEGFVQNIKSGRSMEEAAEGYLMDLIRSNVVMVSRRRYNGKVKYCQVHDVVLHFCLEKSREEKFILAVKGRFQPSHWKESRVSFNYSNKISKFASPGSETQKPFHPHLRSLITTNEAEWSLFHQISKLRLLKVLDLSSHKVRVLSSATFQPLIHLKYLAVETTQFDFYPESHLPNLETLKSFSNHMLIPSIFWKMKNLRHVDMKSAEYDLEEDMWGVFEESSKLENLRILRGVVIKTGDVESVHVLIRRCPNLQELDISFWDDNDSPEICPELESLMQLQTLYLSFDIHLVLSGLHLPSNLKKLGLKCIPIEGVISVIAGLPSLEYLQLWNAVKSKEWFLRDVMFHKLKFLKLVDLSISRLDVSEESFPLLETLVVLRCHYLKEVPLIFADIPTLKQIGCLHVRQNL